MIQEFPNKTELFSAAASNIYADLEKSSEAQADVLMLLSGGSTPGPVYEFLAQKINLKSKLIIGLVDERFVALESEHSNERMIRSKFTKVKGGSPEIISMVKQLGDYEANRMQIEKDYLTFKNRCDVLVLGMGTDGHTASMFPYDEASDQAIRDTQQIIHNTEAPSEPKQRISCSMNLLCSAKNIYLLITGETKLNVLKDESRQLPIHQFLAKRPDTKIYYATK